MYVWQKSYNDHLDNAICLCLHHTSREILNTMIVHATDPCADIYLLSKRQLEHNTGSRVKSPHSVTMVQKYSQVLGATKFSYTSSITQNQQQILIHMYWSEHEQYINRFFYKKHCLGSFIPRITPSVAQDHSYHCLGSLLSQILHLLQKLVSSFGVLHTDQHGRRLVLLVFRADLGVRHTHHIYIVCSLSFQRNRW